MQTELDILCGKMGNLESQFLTRHGLPIEEFFHRWNVKAGDIGVPLPYVLSSSQNLLGDLRGDRNPCFTDQSSEKPADSPEILNIDGAQLSHAALLAVKVVLPLLVGIGQHRVGRAQLLELLGSLLVTRVLTTKYILNFCGET